MSLPHPVSSSSRGGKRPSEETKNKGEELGGSDPVNLGRPQPMPAHCVHEQGENLTLRKESHSGWHPDSVTADESRENQNLTASAEAKSTLRRITESSNVYLPLRSVAKDLCLILDNCGVWPPPRPSIHSIYGCNSKQR